MSLNAFDGRALLVLIVLGVVLWWPVIATRWRDAGRTVGEMTRDGQSPTDVLGGK